MHISEKTLSFLSGEFEVEPALGEKREEALRIAGLKTYFIKKVLKPVSVIGHAKILEHLSNVSFNLTTKCCQKGKEYVQKVSRKPVLCAVRKFNETSDRRTSILSCSIYVYFLPHYQHFLPAQSASSNTIKFELSYIRAIYDLTAYFVYVV